MHGWRLLDATKKDCPQTVLLLTGDFLSSQAVSSQVLSAFVCLTTVFGMGTGGATQPSSPDYSIVADVQSKLHRNKPQTFGLRN